MTPRTAGSAASSSTKRWIASFIRRTYLPRRHRRAYRRQGLGEWACRPPSCRLGVPLAEGGEEALSGSCCEVRVVECSKARDGGAHLCEIPRAEGAFGEVGIE